MTTFLSSCTLSQTLLACGNVYKRCTELFLLCISIIELNHIWVSVWSRWLWLRSA